MYAIVEIGSKQYKVSENDQLLIEKAVSECKQKLTLDKVLLVVKDKKVKIGNPYLKETKVNCEVLGIRKIKKKVALKFRKRKDSQTKKGSRQKQVLVKIAKIQTEK